MSSKPPGPAAAFAGAPRRFSRALACRLAAAALALAIVSPAHGGGRAAPFRLRDLAGHTLALEPLLAKGPVLLEFWATWCAPCRAAFPELEALQREHADCGLTVIGVSADGPRNVAKVRPFVARERLTFPIALDLDGRMQQLYQVSQLPTAVLIDTRGEIVATRVGFRAGESTLAAALAKLCPRAAAAADSAAREP